MMFIYMLIVIMVIVCFLEYVIKLTGLDGNSRVSFLFYVV